MSGIDTSLQRAPRRNTRHLTYLVCIALVVALVPLVLRPGRAHAAASSVADLVSQPGDQVVVVPNGTYKGGGTVNAPHPATSGPYPGRVAQRR